ncbi:MAG TPA: c-type cytochrome [Gammaproteobacteria bacterium]|nr:c-type cytochrome [Gammaproteobacteria bacterium]
MEFGLTFLGALLGFALLIATASGTALADEDALALAKKSGCLACHSVEKKVVGPAWKDVAARYKGDAGARDRLIKKVHTGGKGNWTEVTGGVPMPPYSPRVSDADIEKLVDFVLSLAK